MIMINGCLMCLKDVESVDHLLVNCERSCFVWILILSWFGCSWVLSCSSKALFRAWMKGVGLARGRITWKASFFSATIWVLWEERNSISFEGIFNSKKSLAHKIKFLVASFFYFLQELSRFLIYSLLRC